MDKISKSDIRRVNSAQVCAVCQEKKEMANKVLLPGDHRGLLEFCSEIAPYSSYFFQVKA